MRPNEHSKDYLHGLDGWRAIAVMLVVFGHSPQLPGPLHSLQSGGGLGVRIFFAISGLLICSRLLDEEARFGKISLRNFYLRRVFRILPASTVYLLTLAILGAFAVIPFAWSPWVAGLFFYRNYWSYFHGVDPASWFTAHFWSLSVEEHFYFLLPSIMLFFPRLRTWALGLLSVLSFGWACLYVQQTHSDVTPLWEQRTEFSLVALLVASLFALWLRNSRFRAACERWLNPWVGLVLCALCVTRWIHPFHHLPQNELLGLATKSLLFPLALISLILHPRNIVTRLFDTAPARFVGKISYSLYLWQSLFLTLGEDYSSWPIHPLQKPFVGIACTFACAIASYYFIETPLISAGRRFIASLPARQPLPIPAEPTLGDDIAKEVIG